MQNLINFYPISTKNSSLLNSNIGRNQDKKLQFLKKSALLWYFLPEKKKGTNNHPIIIFSLTK